jgi:hypothetical protein
MKKIIFIISTIILLIVVSIVVYKTLLPSYLADVLTSETAPAFLPEKYKIQIQKINKPINKYSNEIFKVTDSLNLSLEQILKIIDSIKPEDAINIYNKLENRNIEDSEEVFNLIKENIEIDEIDFSLYKGFFLKHVTPSRINRALRYAETHELVANLAPETAKKIAKQIAINHYEEKIGKGDSKLSK